MGGTAAAKQPALFFHTTAAHMLYASAYTMHHAGAHRARTSERAPWLQCCMHGILGPYRNFIANAAGRENDAARRRHLGAEGNSIAPAEAPTNTVCPPEEVRW